MAAVVGEVRGWLDTRIALKEEAQRTATPAAHGETKRGGKRQDTRAQERAARKKWDELRARMLATIRDDAAAATELLGLLGTSNDPEAALYAARVLPFVRPAEFEAELIEVATGNGPVLERQVALVGLRGRGAGAAIAVATVATQAEERGLKLSATDELAAHAADPGVIDKRWILLAAARQNLEHGDADIRLSALRALAVSPQSDPSAVDRLTQMAAKDPDETVRRYAALVLKRWTPREG